MDAPIHEDMPIFSYILARPVAARGLVAGLILALTALAVEARQSATAWDSTEVSDIRLISAQDSVGDGAVSLGLQIRLAPTWKTYWRSPGEAGFPPRIDWTGSTNLESVDIAWPAPTRFLEIGDLVTHGYMDEVVFPLAVRATDPSLPLVLRAVVDYPVCQEICYPFQASFTLELPPGVARPTEHGGDIARFLARVPGPPKPGQPRLASVEAAGDGADQILRITARSPSGFIDPEIFVEGPPAFYFGPPKIEIRDGGTEAVIRIAAPAPRGGAALAGEAIIVTLVDGTAFIEQTLTAVPGDAEAPPFSNLVMIVALAFLGGLILNLMPCVLPVLSLKVVGVIGMGGVSRAVVSARFLATAAGIVLSFMALAAGVAGLKAAGVAVGWGLQFQEPLFLVALIIVITLFASNMWDLFQFPLPAWLGGIGGVEKTHGMAGHFASGAFATLLATPCSAPFLGTAVGFALARGTPEIFTVFAALGVGMATPYLAIAAAPGLATRLPHPGRWMVTLKRFLALLLAATALWLLTVLAAQSGARASLAVGGLMAAGVAVMLWNAAAPDRRRRFAAAPLLVLVFALAFLAPGGLRGTGIAAPTDDAIWRPFDAALIDELVASGKTVFVDVTADWCVTCKFNEATVLSRGAVARQLASEGVVAMRADWTNPNPAIAAYLETFGRFGIPFDAIYGPALPRGLALPELLSEDAVMAAFGRAGSALVSND
jgi:suppressor for copper-sensitivity B